MIPYNCPICTRCVEHSSSASRQDTCRCHTHLHAFRRSSSENDFIFVQILSNVAWEITLKSSFNIILQGQPMSKSKHHHPKSSYHHLTRTVNVNVTWSRKNIWTACTPICTFSTSVPVSTNLLLQKKLKNHIFCLRMFVV